VRDWRYAVRIANIDVTQLSGGTPPNLINAMIRGLYRLPTTPAGIGATIDKSDAPTIQGGNGGRVVIYCNRVIRTYLDIQATNKTNVLLQMNQFDGKMVTTFRGVPIKTCDAILNTESRLT
jgi:hypothetical protein